MDAKYMKESKRETLIMQDIQRIFTNDVKKLSGCQKIQSTPRSRCSTPKPLDQRPGICADDPLQTNGYTKFCQRLETEITPKLRNTNRMFFTVNGFISGNLIMPHNQGYGPKVTENEDDLRKNMTNLKMGQARSDDKKIMIYIPSSKRIIKKGAQLFVCRNGFRNCTEC